MTSPFDFERRPLVAIWEVTRACQLACRHCRADSIHVRNPGELATEEWKRLFEQYPERFLLGSDTWVNERWDSYGSIMADYRAWLAQLPPGVAESIAFRNAEQLFKR